MVGIIMQANEKNGIIIITIKKAFISLKPSCYERTS